MEAGLTDLMDRTGCAQPFLERIRVLNSRLTEELSGFDHTCNRHLDCLLIP